MLSLEDMAALIAAEEKRLGVNSPEFRRADTLLYTTHNPALVGLADRVYIMKKGRIAACGTPDEVRNLPAYREWERDT